MVFEGVIFIAGGCWARGACIALALNNMGLFLQRSIQCLPPSKLPFRLRKFKEFICPEAS